MSLIFWLPLNRQTYSTIPNQGLLSTSITHYGSTIVYTAGKIGQAPNFSNSAFVINPAPITTNMNEFSFAFWYKTPLNNSPQCLYAGCNSYLAAISVYLLDGKINVVDGLPHIFDYVFPADIWVHVCITRDDKNIKLYINGNLEETQTSTAFTCDVTFASIGMSSENTATPSGENLLGQLNDYRIYNHTLSIKEVRELAKGMVMHLPLSWGGNPNMIKNSYTWMNKTTGANNSTGNLTSWTKGVYEDNTAPCKWVFRCTGVNLNSSATSGVVGTDSTYSTQGVSLSDLVENETYTYSFWARITPESTGTTTFREGAICEGQTVLSSTGFGNLTTEWRKHTVTFKWTSTNKLTICFYTSFPANSTVTYELCGLKLEKSSKATPYIPNESEPEYISMNYATKYLQDCSGYNKIINKYGSPAETNNSPRYGTAVYLSGSNINCDNGFPTNAPMPEWSIVFWFMPDIGKTFNAWSDVFRFSVMTQEGSSAQPQQFRLETQNSGGNSYQLFYNNQGSSAYGGGSLTTITEKKWYHLAFVCNGTTIKQYINSELIREHTINSGYHPTAPTGYIQFGDNGGMHASFSDCRVYATPLSADDIKELYQVSASIDKSGNIYCYEVVE